MLRLRPRRKKVRARFPPLHYVNAARCGHRQSDRRLRGCSACSNGAMQGVRWTDDTVDNEDMGKKKSKSELLSCAMFVRQYCIARILDQSKRSTAEQQGACGTVHNVGILTRNECCFRLQSAASSTSSGASVTGQTATTAGTTAMGTAARGSASIATQMQCNHPKAEQTAQQQHSVQTANGHSQEDVQHVGPFHGSRMSSRYRMWVNHLVLLLNEYVITARCLRRPGYDGMHESSSCC